MSEAKSENNINDNGQGDDDVLNMESVNKISSDEGDEGYSESTVNHLPPEILVQIFKNVESPKDLLSCWNTSSAWNKSFRSSTSKDKQYFLFKMSLPLVLPYLSRSDLLKCSSVSKPWNVTVDACIQDAEDYGGNNRLNEHQQVLFQLDSAQFPEFVHTIMSSANNESGRQNVAINPVAFQRCRVHVHLRKNTHPNAARRNTNHLTIVLRSLLKCLDFCGHLIRHFNLCILDCENFSCFHKLNLIKCCLERTPNLRVFKIYGSNSENCNDENEPVGDLEEFKVNENPWPTLEHLKVLKFHELTRVWNYAFIAEAYANQLLQLEFGYGFMEWLQPFAEQFSCLEKIVFLFAKDDSFGVIDPAAFAQSIPSAIKHLTVVFLDDPKDESKSLTMAFNAASTSLEKLVFSRPFFSVRADNYNFDITKFKELRLPRLKVLDLCAFGYPSFDFLQSVCPMLQQLTVTPLFSNDFDSGERKMLESTKRYCDLYLKDQFWNRLADMQIVDVEHVFEYTLNEYEDAFGKISKKKLPEGNIGKVFIRRFYESNLGSDFSMEIDNHLSFSEEEDD